MKPDPVGWRRAIGTAARSSGFELQVLRLGPPASWDSAETWKRTFATKVVLNLFFFFPTPKIYLAVFSACTLHWCQVRSSKVMGHGPAPALRGLTGAERPEQDGLQLPFGAPIMGEYCVQSVGVVDRDAKAAAHRCSSAASKRPRPHTWKMETATQLCCQDGARQRSA